jgi:isoleucyl-tRNA synthetase
MAAYRLYTVVPKLLEFIEQLTNWYVRMNRSRLKGKFGADDSAAALSTLFHVLLSLCKLMAPFTPFFVDFMYQNLRRALPLDQQAECVHYEMIPTEDAAQVNPRVEERVSRMQKVIELGRIARDSAKITMRKPLRSALVVHSSAAYLADVSALKSYVLEELNVRALDTSNEVDKFIVLKGAPNRKALGGRFGKNSPAFAKAIGELTHAELLPVSRGGSVTISGEVLTSAEIDVSMNFQGDRKKLMDAGDGDVLVILNIEEDAQLVQESLAREVTRRVQQLRKEAGLVPTDDCEVFYRPFKAGEANNVCTAIVEQAAYVRATLGRDLHAADPFLPAYASGAALLAQGTLELEGEQPVQFYLTRLFVSVDEAAVGAAVAAAGLPPTATRTAVLYLAYKDWSALHTSASAAGAVVAITIDGKRVELKRGTHFFLSVKERQEVAKWGSAA